MPRTKNASRAKRPLIPSDVSSSSDSLGESSSAHSQPHPSSVSPPSLGVFSADSHSSRPSPSSQPSPSSFSAPPVDPEYAALATRVASQAILKEKPFPLTPVRHPFVQQLINLQLSHLALPRNTGNLTFVRQYYANARHSNTYGINFRGVSIPQAFTSAIIREHFHLPVVPRCHYSELIHEYPYDDVIRTLCPEGIQWHQPRGAQRYIRRTDLLPEARPWLHFICNNILPTLHKSMVPKEQALYIYLLMVGRPVNLPLAIVSALRQCILATNVKHYLLFPHLISDLFRAYRVPEHPTDLTFEPAPPFIYVRVGKPRNLPPPPPPPPIPAPPLSSPPPIPSPPHPPSSPPPPPSPPPPVPIVSPEAPPPVPSETALLREEIRQLTAQVAATHSLITMIAAHLGLPVPPPAPAPSAAPPDPPVDDSPA